MRNRLPRRFAILAAAACLLGFATAIHPMPPSAHADALPNGYSVTCTPSGGKVICNISGCPRVHADEAGDVVHVRSNGGPQEELSKACGNTATESFGNNPPAAFTVSIQGCRKHFPGSDDCGAWSDYHYTPPAPAQAGPPADNQKPIKCTGGPDAGKTLPPGSTCAVAAAPVKCPAGSVTDTVPAGQQCGAPTNAVALNITRSGFNAHAAVTNNSSLPAKCSYTATKSGGLGPQEVDRSIDVGANSTSSITDMGWPPLGTSYNAVVKCTVTYNGRQTSIGQASQNVSG
jgi:hypothetical protein